MDERSMRAYLLGKPGATVGEPFGPGVEVFKVMGKMFAILPVGEAPPSVSLKCDPVHARLLREQYPAVQPGYHLNKKHWNTVTLDGTIPEDELWEMVDESYGLVRDGLTRAQRTELEATGRATD